MTTVSAVLVPYDETQPLQLVQIPQNPEEDLELWTRGLNSTVENIYDVRQRLLIRQTSSQSTEAAGLYACCVIPKHTPIMVAYKNVRATRLAMACGRFSISLYGNVLLIRSSLASRENLSVEEVYGPCCISPDLRKVLLTEIIMSSVSSTTISSDANFDIPSWLGNALQQNYHDASVLSKLATVMTGTAETGCSDDESDGDESDKNGDDIDDEREKQNNANETAKTTGAATKFVTKQPLCIYCRGPASKLCEGCQACYFCDAPRLCKALGWTHGCLCSTWRIYTERRNKLSAFSYLGDWTKALTAEAFYSSEQPYADFLLDQLGMSITTQQNGNGGSLDHAGSWWSTELHGWAAGQSQSAKSVDIFQRRSYAEGFAPLAEHDIPAQRPVHEQDFVGALLTKNAVGLWQLSSWEDYYRVRDLPPSSLAALLCTSPLTVYNGIVRYGEVPCTVARMLKRPLRIHIVGVEKEANFLDLFQEVGFLLPQDFRVEIAFVFREDMLPAKHQKSQETSSSQPIVQIQLCPNLSAIVVSGTYGDSLDPNFDCGKTGTPDMIMGLNAGLYAYETWRSVVTYLHKNSGVVGVFTDYNEYSGVNCAALAGHSGRESLSINPFRQPLSMPVYSMNLPQFSNGFYYVMNAQELDQ